MRMGERRVAGPQAWRETCCWERDVWLGHRRGERDVLLGLRLNLLLPHMEPMGRTARDRLASPLTRGNQQTNLNYSPGLPPPPLPEGYASSSHNYKPPLAPMAALSVPE